MQFAIAFRQRRAQMLCWCQKSFTPKYNTAIHASPFTKKNMKPKNPSLFSQFFNLLLFINRFTMFTCFERSFKLLSRSDGKTPPYKQKTSEYVTSAKLDPCCAVLTHFLGDHPN